jgi:hypothetical protein
MTKYKRSYENSVNIILNDDYKENIILMHHEEIEKLGESTAESLRKISYPQRKFGVGARVKNPGEIGDISSMKQIKNRNNIFDEESMDLGSLPQNQVHQKDPGPRKKSILEIQKEMKEKDAENKKKKKGNSGG